MTEPAYWALAIFVWGFYNPAEPARFATRAECEAQRAVFQASEWARQGRASARCVPVHYRQPPHLPKGMTYPRLRPIAL